MAVPLIHDGFGLQRVGFDPRPPPLVSKGLHGSEALHLHSPATGPQADAISDAALPHSTQPPTRSPSQEGESGALLCDACPIGDYCFASCAVRYSPDMARRRKKQTSSIYPVTALVLVFGWIFLELMRSKDFAGVIFVFGFTALVCMVLYGVIPKWKQEKLFERVDAITDEQIDALIRQRTILVRSDAYGKSLLDKWHSEVNYFITHHVRPGIKLSQISLLEKKRSTVLERIAQRVALTAQQRPAALAIPASMNGAEFEAFCASQLRADGWNVQLTPLCRDQGVDVIAEKNSLRVALQCKLYSNPVGNKAVQEIAAGRVHQGAQHGAVVTNGTFTASAKELAATNGIRLLHYSDLPKLELILSKPATE